VADDRIWFIPNGVDVEKFSPASSIPVTTKEPRSKETSDTQEEALTTDQEGTHENSSQVEIGFAGIICRRKGVRELFDAYELICSLDDIPPPVLRLAGPLEGVEEVSSSFVREAIRTARVCGEEVQLLGKVDDMPHFYRSLDLFVLPSYREGMPNVLLEAMATGLPCVVTDIPGVQEVIASGENGVLVPQQDAQQLATALSELLRDKTLRHSIGRAARKTIVDSFSLNAMAGRYTELFISLSESEFTEKPAIL
jgi:glycosyltransferase involved in cell wall biosynthesis